MQRWLFLSNPWSCGSGWSSTSPSKHRRSVRALIRAAGADENLFFLRLCVCACVSDPCDSWMVFAVQPDPSGLNKLDTLGQVVGAGVLAVTDCSRTDPIRCRNADADLQRHALAVTGPFVRACTCFTDSDLSCVKVPILSKFT